MGIVANKNKLDKSRFDFYFSHFQHLPSDFIKDFSLSRYQNHKELQKQKETWRGHPDFNEILC